MGLDGSPNIKEIKMNYKNYYGLIAVLMVAAACAEDNQGRKGRGETVVEAAAPSRAPTVMPEEFPDEFDADAGIDEGIEEEDGAVADLKMAEQMDPAEETPDQQPTPGTSDHKGPAKRPSPGNGITGHQRKNPAPSDHNSGSGNGGANCDVYLANLNLDPLGKKKKATQTKLEVAGPCASGTTQKGTEVATGTGAAGSTPTIDIPGTTGYDKGTGSDGLPLPDGMPPTGGKTVSTGTNSGSSALPIGLTLGQGQGKGKGSAMGSQDLVFQTGGKTGETTSGEAANPAEVADDGDEVKTCRQQGLRKAVEGRGKRSVGVIAILFDGGIFNDEVMTYISDSTHLMLGNGRGSIAVLKGPNYVDGDAVMVKNSSSTLLQNTELEPGFYNSEALADLGIEAGTIIELAFNKVLASTGSGSPGCAEKHLENDIYRYYPKIPLSVRMYYGANRGGEGADIIYNVADLDDLDHGFGGDASSVRILKGPDWESTARVQFFDDEDFENPFFMKGAQDTQLIKGIYNFTSSNEDIMSVKIGYVSNGVLTETITGNVLSLVNSSIKIDLGRNP